MFDACEKGDFSEVKRLVNRQSSLEEKNRFGETPLMIAIVCNHLSIVEFLLTEGSSLTATCTIARNTPLHFAAYIGNVSIVSLLIAHGARKDVKNNQGMTPLMTASQEGHLEIVRLFLDVKNINEKNYFGKNALMLAAETGKFEIVKCLVEEGHADVSVVDLDSKSASQLAADNHHTSIVNFLSKPAAAESDLNSKVGLLIKQVRSLENHAQKEIKLREGEHHYIKQLEEQLTRLQSSTESIHNRIHSLETRLDSTEQRDNEFGEALTQLRKTMTEQAASIDTLKLSLEILQSLQTRLTRLEEGAASSIATDISSALMPEQLAYIGHFKKILVRTHMAAMIISTGLFKIAASGGLGKVGQVLNVMSSAAPLGLGIGVKMLAYCLQVADQTLAMRRMERLTLLGNESGEVAQLSEQLSARLIYCLHLDNRIQKQHVMKFLSGSLDMAQSVAQSGFYGALTQISEMVINPLIEHNEEISATEKRAEQDANLLLAAIAENDILTKSTPNIDLLFLYAMPLLTVVDQIFFLILTQFATQNHIEPGNITINIKKRGLFYKNITDCWHQHAEFVAEKLAEDTQRERLTRQVATLFSSTPNGVFYFKENTNLTIFSSEPHKKRHASWRKDALLPTSVAAIMDTTMNNW